MIDLAADIVPNTTKGFSPVLMKATKFPTNITHLLAIKILGGVNSYYSKSLRFGFRDGSLERSPKINKETKKIIVV
jgi:hypothetical protein